MAVAFIKGVVNRRSTKLKILILRTCVTAAIYRLIALKIPVVIRLLRSNVPLRCVAGQGGIWLARVRRWLVKFPTKSTRARFTLLAVVRRVRIRRRKCSVSGRLRLIRKIRNGWRLAIRRLIRLSRLYVLLVSLRFRIVRGRLRCRIAVRVPLAGRRMRLLRLTLVVKLVSMGQCLTMRWSLRR